MALLHQTRLDILWKISHFKSTHNPPYTYSPITFCSKHESMKGWTSISNQEKDIIGYHTSHPTSVKTSKIDVPFDISSVGYQD